jgi:hypothetical protein
VAAGVRGVHAEAEPGHILNYWKSRIIRNRDSSGPLEPRTNVIDSVRPITELEAGGRYGT